MRQPLDDITNTIVSDNHNSSSTHTKSNTITSSTSQTPYLPKTILNTRPKLLRQTSLLAFAASRGPAPVISSSSPPPIASTSSSPPPLPPSSSSASASSSFHPASDEGYHSTRDLVSELDLDLDCVASASTREDGDADDDDAYSSAEEEQEQQQQQSNKRQRVHFASSSPSSNQYHERLHDPATLARQAKAMQRNRANLFGDNSRVGGFENLVRLKEYSRSNGLGDHTLAARIRDTRQDQHLNSFVSHYSKDVFRCASMRGYRDFAPPFACSFSKASKNGGKKILAVSDEEGTVSLLDAEQKPEGHGSLATSFQAHHNAVFDLVWSADDRYIATASGDQTAGVSDVETHAKLYTLKQHTCSVKQITFDPHNPNLLATASRDGSIGLWDLRAKPTKDGSLSTVNHIRFAHDTYAKTRKSKDVARSVTRSVTSVCYLQHQDNLLASAGSADGVVKLWDLRKTFSKRINPPSLEESLDYTPVSSFDIQGPPSTSSSPMNSLLSSTFSSSSSATISSSSASFATPRTTRTHGVSSLCLSPDGSRLYALSTNSKIYAHDALFLSRPLSAPIHTYSSPTMCSSSFYVRLAMSPDGKYLSCGSSSNGWQTSIWDLQTHSARTVYGETKNATASLKGHKHEVGGIDWADGILATCGDDNTVRVWRPQEDIARQAREHPKSDARTQHAGVWDMVDLE